MNELTASGGALHTVEDMVKEYFEKQAVCAYRTCANSYLFDSKYCCNKSASNSGCSCTIQWLAAGTV